MSKTRNTGGVVIYVKKELKFKIIYSNAVEDNIWCLMIEILESDFKGNYGCFYRANKARNDIFEN